MTSHNSTTMKAARPTTKPLVVGALGFALTLLGCTGDGEVGGSIDGQLRSETLLSGDLLPVNGAYGAGCTDRAGAWSGLIDPAAEMDNPELSVLLNAAPYQSFEVTFHPAPQI